MNKALTDMGVQFIVVEADNPSGLEIYDTFRELLRDKSEFKLHKVIPVQSNHYKLEGQRLLIYENLHWPGVTPNKELHLRLPVVGQTIEIKLEKILDR